MVDGLGLVQDLKKEAFKNNILLSAVEKNTIHYPIGYPLDLLIY